MLQIYCRGKLHRLCREDRRLRYMQGPGHLDKWDRCVQGAGARRRGVLPLKRLRARRVRIGGVLQPARGGRLQRMQFKHWHWRWRVSRVRGTGAELRGCGFLHPAGHRRRTL